MATIGFIGLGVMGSPMAVNLVRVGHTVVGYNRTPLKTAALVEAGGRATDTIADAVASADLVALNLPDSPDVEEVLTGTDGVFAHAAPGTVIVDFSTIAPDVAIRMAEVAETADLMFLDAPRVRRRGGRGRGQPVDHGRRLRRGIHPGTPDPLDLGSTVVYVGPSGSGQTVKAANQLIVAGQHPGARRSDRLPRSPQR